MFELRGGRRAVVAGATGGSVPGNGGDHARGKVDLADAFAVEFGDEEVAAAVHGDADGDIDLRGGGQAVVAAGALQPVASHRGDDTRGKVDLADAVVERIGDEEVSAVVHRYAPGLKSSAAVAGPLSPL